MRVGRTWPRARSGFLFYGTPALPAQSAPPAASDATAEDAKDPTEMEEIVVSFSQSLVKALDEKRSNVGQVDVIVAEDIGKFPDLNLAESLQRIPGVSIARDAGGRPPGRPPS